MFDHADTPHQAAEPFPADAGAEPAEAATAAQPSTDTLFQQAVDAYRSGNTADCLANLEQILDVDPTHTAARLRYAVVLLEQQRFDAALSEAALCWFPNPTIQMPCR